jgi:hypothetical protein
VKRLFAVDQGSRPIGFLYGLLTLLASCAAPAAFEAMIPNSFDTARKHSRTVHVQVTGGQDKQSADPIFPIPPSPKRFIKSQTFSRVVDDKSSGAEYLLAATLFSIDKRIFGETVKLEAGWTLRRVGSAVNVWQESIVSEYTGANVKLATEGAAKNNIAAGLAKISKLTLE